MCDHNNVVHGRERICADCCAPVDRAENTVEQLIREWRARQCVADNVPLGACLDEAKYLITGARQGTYGAPEDSFALVAAYWETYLSKKHETGEGLNAKDVAHMMMLLKIARTQGQGSKRDNYIDICGYAAIAADRLSKKSNP